MSLEIEIMELLRKHSKDDTEYINPNFLSELANLLSEYYNLEDEQVYKYIEKMWSR